MASTNLAERLAFTLTELLVVIVVIAILVAILLSVTASVLESGYRTKCINNQRQLMVGVIAYANDHDGLLPYPNWRNEVPGWLYTPPNAATDQDLQAGQIWTYVKTPGVYRCPLDRPSTEQLQQRFVKICSYCMNGAVCGYGRLAPPASPYNLPNTYPISRFSGTAVCFWEQDEGSDGYWFNDASNEPDEAITKRHKGGAIISCFDGHVEWMTWDEYNAQKDISPGRFWCNPGINNGH